MNKYLKFEYWNTCDLGNIYYQGGQKFMFYLDADVGEPLHEDVEEGQENGDGDFIPTYRRQIKRYRIRTGLIPDFLIDAMQRMKLHDNIELTFKTGEVEQIYNVDIEPEWQFEKYAWQGTVTMTFDMNESITVGACCDNLVVGTSEEEPIPDLYWVAENGSDLTGNGSYARPWATLAYACTQAVTPGDVIHVKAGTITETSQIVLAVGVDIVGQGDTSIIRAGTAFEPMILMSSVDQGTDGSQTIRDIQFDGEMTALFGFSVRRRSNVIFDNVTMVDFIYSAIEIYGGSGFASTPTTYASGNIIRNCTVTNCCSRRDPSPFGSLRIGGTVGMEVHHCTLTQTSRASTENGNLVYMWGSPNKGFKFHHNYCTKPNTDGVVSGNAGGWNFHIESGPCNGAEIYNNTFIGGVALDLAGGNQVKGDYAYSWWVHHNDFSLSSQINKPASGTHSPMGMDFERTCEDVIVENNIFTNYPSAINFTVATDEYSKTRIYFRYNIFRNAGYADADYAYHIVWQGGSSATGDLASHFYFYNNVFHANLGRAFFGLLCPYDLRDIYIRNNIFVNAHLNGWMIVPAKCGDLVTDTGTFYDFYIDNNLMYNNANSNNIRYVDGKTMTIESFANNILGNDPLFVSSGSDFRLQAGSPAINAGINVGLANDYAGHSVSDPPEIGAYEY